MNMNEHSADKHAETAYQHGEHMDHGKMTAHAEEG